MFKRIVTALETVAGELRTLRQELQAIRQEQREFMALSQREAEKGPSRILEMFEQAKTLIGGKTDGR